MLEKKETLKQKKIPKYEDYIKEIDEELLKKRSKWQLTAIAWCSYEDVSQIIRLHLWRKMYLYDTARSFRAWASTVISHQITNLIRNNYSNFSRPCLKCVCAEGENLCSIFGTQNNSCPLFKKWELTKKSAFETKLPLPLENHQQEVYDLESNHVDIEKTAPNIHNKMQLILKKHEWKVYDYLFLQNLSEEETAQKLGYKASRRNKSVQYKMLSNIRKIIVTKVRKLLYAGEIDIVV